MFIIFDNYNQPTLFTNLQIYCDLNCCSLVTWIYHHKADTLHQNLVPILSPYDLRVTALWGNTTPH